MSDSSTREVQEVREISSTSTSGTTRTASGPETNAASARARSGGAADASTSSSATDGFEPSEPSETSFLDLRCYSRRGTSSTAPARVPEEPAPQPVDEDGKPIPQGVTREAVRPVKPTDFQEEHAALDKDGDGKVTAGDMGLDQEAFQKLDANKDGKLSKDEYRADYHRRNSFEALDADGDGNLSTEELAKLDRFTARSYDANGDGTVDATEFEAGRREEMKLARRQHVEQKLAGLEGDDLDRMVEKFDADGDGKVTADEVLAGRREARNKERTDRAEQNFEALAGDDEAIAVADQKAYGVYDADGDGKVSREEFLAGQKADYQAIRDQRYLDGARSPKERKRLGIDAAGNPVAASSTAGSVDIGNIQDLTYDQAKAIVQAQGGKLFENGQPTVLALRTGNSGTKEYEDYFVVLKPNGQMAAFAASTRPGFTTPSGGWNPEMVVPGNYSLTPRWRDGQFNNDAFILGNTGGGMSVPTAVDRNADGVYSDSEIASPSSSTEIRLHRGNADSTSSAGCFNVQDYDAFLEFLGGRDVSFNLTLVEMS